jgi:hypothetical protein
MYAVDRSAVVIRMKQPYLDWTNSLPDSDEMTLDELNRDNNVYMIPEYDTRAHLESILQEFCTDIFEEELSSWYRDEEAWPQVRDYPTFKKWFEAEPYSMVFDLLDQNEEV